MFIVTLENKNISWRHFREKNAVSGGKCICYCPHFQFLNRYMKLSMSLHALSLFVNCYCMCNVLYATAFYRCMKL